jgi:NitT/TauT family transport system substrate-binding protein
MTVRFLLLTTLIACLLFGCSGSTTPTNTLPTLRVGTVEWVGFAPLNVGVATGMFQTNGVAVTVKTFTDNRELNQALKNGEVDVALDMIGSWLDMAQEGVDIAVLGITNWSDGGDKIVVQGAIANASDFLNTKAGVYLDLLSVQHFLSLYLDDSGITRQTFLSIEEHAPDTLAQKFANNEMSLMVNYEPYVQIGMASGTAKVVATSRQFPGCIPEGFACKKSFLTSANAAILGKFFSGWTQALQWSQDPANTTEFFAIINEQTFPNQPPFSETEIANMLLNIKFFTASELAVKNSAGGELFTYTNTINKRISSGHLPGTTVDTVGLFRTTEFVTALQSVGTR